MDEQNLIFIFQVLLFLILIHVVISRPASKISEGEIEVKDVDKNDMEEKQSIREGRTIGNGLASILDTLGL